ncbi:Ferredoxin reductase [Rhodococcus wratislaviensis]|uniref:Ferredoxin reductase n=1 Tax=Rhodococcus wratislaviensis TaxID=44752 RepID=A0A402CEW6_RHOWR|nr:Ferredoxin reductase [Rhodococcus wratislaviensis]
MSLRELGYDAPITMVGAESHPPYQRPPLSKAFLAGDASAESLEFRNSEFYKDKGIDLLCSTRITDLQVHSSGGVATALDGRQFPFEKLALTTGAAPRRVKIPGSDLGGILYLRGIDDAVALQKQLETARDVVVVGGGFIGLEAAAVCRKRGKNVTVVEAMDSLLSRVAAPAIADFFLAAHQRRGTRFRLGSGVVALHGKGGTVSAVELADGSYLDADLVLIGIGVVPEIELAEQIGAVCDGAIVVDARAQTSVPGVVAAGDCVIGPNPLGGTDLVRLESVQNAVDQAKVAAATLVGIDMSYEVVPWFWSDQGEIKLHMAGLTTGYDQIVMRGDPATEKFSVLYYRNGQFLAINAVNRAPDYLAARAALTAGSHIPAELAGDEQMPLKKLVVAGAQITTV